MFGKKEEEKGKKETEKKSAGDHSYPHNISIHSIIYLCGNKIINCLK